MPKPPVQPDPPGSGFFPSEASGAARRLTRELGTLTTTTTLHAVVSQMRRLGVHLRAIDRAPWIEDAEQRLGFRLPESFRSLVTHYTFSPVELDRAELFGNRGDRSEFDLAVAIFRDAHMSPWLAAHRLVHIGYPFLGDYDPICLDASAAADPIVVCVNHEDVLQDRTGVRRQMLAPTFLEFLRGSSQSA